MLAALYRLLAETERAIAQSAAEAGDDETARVALGRQRAFLRMADEASRGNVGVVVGLTEANTSVNLDPMTPAHREAISRARGRATKPMQAARAAGYRSQAEAATALGVSEAFFSQVLSGSKSMPADRAAEFERLTGYPASRWK